MQSLELTKRLHVCSFIEFHANLSEQLMGTSQCLLFIQQISWKIEGISTHVINASYTQLNSHNHFVTKLGAQESFLSSWPPSSCLKINGSGVQQVENVMKITVRG